MGNLRRSRGYGFEAWLVKKFNELPNWSARRLGGASTGLPDVVAVNNSESILLAIEAKSLRGKSVDIPVDEIERCHIICEMFKLYENRLVVVATRLGDNKKPIYSYFSISYRPNIRSVTGYIGALRIRYERYQYLETIQTQMPWQKD